MVYRNVHLQTIRSFLLTSCHHRNKQKWAQCSRPLFGLCILWSNGWMDQDATRYGGRPWPMQHCVRWGPSLSQKGAQQPPTFRSMSTVAKQSLFSATVELLFQKK